MSMHTPGPWIAKGDDGRFLADNPWTVDHDESGRYTSVPIHANGQVLAMVVMDGERQEDWMDDTELEANATLMAAAPELLDDLREAAATLRRYEALHRAKNTEESTTKAEVNAELATRFEATIAKATRTE